ncbi:MAG: hypothetical protein AAGA85_22595 [Bacteroidota bacterium]
MLTNPFRYVILTLLRKPSPYHLRRNGREKNQFHIYYFGGSIYEGTKRQCLQFARQNGFKLNPSLYI